MLMICRVLSTHSRSIIPIHLPDLAISLLEMLLNVFNLDHLPLGWRYKPKESTPELVPEFNKVISSPVQSLCHEWCDIVQRFSCRDPGILAMFTSIIPVLLHWIAAMGMMGELNRALRGLYDLHNWAVRAL